MIKPVIYSLQFRGRATSSDPGRFRLRLTAPTSAHVTMIGPEGVHSVFEEFPGGEAAIDAELVLDEGSAFHEVGLIMFGRHNRVRYRSAAEGHLTACPDPNLRHGVVIHEVEGGNGQFAGAEGFITSNFLVSHTGEFTDHQFGLIYINDTTPDGKGAT